MSGTQDQLLSRGALVVGSMVGVMEAIVIWS